jgi:hypothetical protein
MLPVRLGFVYKIFTLRTKADGSHFAEGFVGQPNPDHIEPVELHAEEQAAQNCVAALYAGWE